MNAYRILTRHLTRFPCTSKGTTLVELMIAVTLIGIVAIGVVGSFATIGKAIQFSKSRTLATNLAQEQVQILKQKAFNKILVTTATANIPGFTPAIPYDTGYYPPENILEGGIRFTRYTYVQVAQENSGTLVYLGAVSDTGMKAITVTVVWAQGTENKKIQIRNIVSNIETTMTNSAITGKVTSSTSGAGIPLCLVTLAENVGYQDYTNSSGDYTINLSPGSYSMYVSAQGFFSQYRSVTVSASSTSTQDFSLTPMSSGTIRGTAWINDHLVIANVVGSTRPAGPGTFEQEWVLVFNPTTYSWTMNGEIGLKYQKTNSDPSVDPIQITYLTPSVAASDYYLFANTTTVNIGGIPVNADAVWDATPGGFNDFTFPFFDPTVTPQQLNIIATDADGGNEGGGALDLYRVSSGQSVDKIGWNKNGLGHTAPFYEGTPLQENIGLQEGEEYVRKSSTAGVSTSISAAYDSNNNNVDFVPRNPILAVLPSTITVAGTPAIGAFVTCVDGLSQVTTALSAGSPPYAEFQLTSVATGTWTVYITSGSYYTTVGTVAVTANNTTWIPNATTDPAWPLTGYYAAFISTLATEGYVSGWVRNSAGAAISPSITVKASALSTLANTTNGTYLLELPAGTYEVIANPNNTNTSYTSQSSPTVTVSVGQVVSNVNFTLSQAGRIRGYITRDGTNPIPGVAVIAYDTGNVVRDEEISGSDGYFTLVNLATGTYTVEPVLGSGESSNPLYISTTVTAGSLINIGSFTITGAFGTIRGSVEESGVAIQTGVLIIASTSSFTSPPVLSSASLTGSAYYVTNSYEDGTYILDVRGSTTAAYNLIAYYTKFNGTTPVISSRTASASVTAGNTTSGINFTW